LLYDAAYPAITY